MSIKLQVANFKGDKNEIVAWVAIVEGKLPGLKKSKVKVDGADKWVPACSPETIIAILEAPREELLAVCRESLRLATPKPEVVAARYFHLSNGVLQLDDTNLPVQLTAEQVMAVDAEVSLFCKVGSQQWSTAKELGLVAAPVAPPVPPSVPAPPAPPAMPPTTVAPIATETMAPPAHVVPKTAIVTRAEDAMQRILAKRAS